MRNKKKENKIEEVEDTLDGILQYYDPPSGWKYGFPKIYKPLRGETLEDTLRRDGYPESLMSLAKTSTRFWKSDVPSN